MGRVRLAIREVRPDAAVVGECVPTPPEGRPTWRTIRVQVDRPEANERARKGYYAGG